VHPQGHTRPLAVAGAAAVRSTPIPQRVPSAQLPAPSAHSPIRPYFAPFVPGPIDGFIQCNTFAAKLCDNPWRSFRSSSLPNSRE
jgi:hypothetical protein